MPDAMHILKIWGNWAVSLLHYLTFHMPQCSPQRPAWTLLFLRMMARSVLSPGNGTGFLSTVASRVDS